ncbi:hypothetical protein LTR91_024228 [Friedmanniomyces endolithicus]|uniref:Tr-type G domain-containing protein n=1 Tax=Friedmanniomyces endolithicus TaxID=329885 RepID=A0AAN6FK97_9PEZI|nr:hypothetical protein LTR35_002187 [Friedmanniomyces endolithicus]KAK0299769.1 hypothetical protein LTS00_001539 [Friedmanniomyces endolithicus]KAK0319246.1 hypothetical protein LTR82_009663 [Friedmanniomyces endolithicus]KAK0826183.1 hypothetical protein LTR73_006517 [Friedmanniomyces endolithicus]KAK0952743.1 hypothetical protein LTR91_024228 [Friedmanniomyces endolithicus]
MASIFTYDPDPPRVTSPWLHPRSPSPVGDSADILSSTDTADGSGLYASSKGLELNPTATRLIAEPQEGPVEYKLHLLLRPRRKFRSTSTGNHMSNPGHPRFGLNVSAGSVSDLSIEAGTLPIVETPPNATVQQTRQHRLEQLTTQLLWRLQQSSPHHASSATNIILPSLPEALPELQAPHQPAKLLHGLEESQGALYELGVADDGTLVGLAEDELEESMNNLRAMAACLGCTVEILRTEEVGNCEWIEEGGVATGRKQGRLRRMGRLVVAEAFVKPHLQVTSPTMHAQAAQQHIIVSHISDTSSTATEQLRVTLTGATMSGKSSLLGTLTTSTLDNGRGKSRLSMLKHRHEITSGVTSSVTSELLGYQDAQTGEVNVVNYASENVGSWIDMHVAAANSRLVFVSDSAGHPRYRRTTVRSLVGWAPHWTLLCVPADDTEDTAGKTGSTNALQQDFSAAVSDIDLSSAQLNLCLRLKLPLVVVITKLDLASRSGLKGTLTKVLDALKAAGRKATIVPNGSAILSESDLQTISTEEIETAYNAALPLLNSPLDTVPIVLTSAMHGTGIRNLHALLHELPLPDTTRAPPAAPGVIFHIEDIYSKPAGVDGITVVSGLIRHGRISLGDTLTIGPFSAHDHPDDSEDSDERSSARRPSSHLPTSRSFPGALRNLHLVPPRFHLPGQEWRAVTVTSIRNLRLPVHALLADQVGTIAIRLEGGVESSSGGLARVRKGMVLATSQPLATKTFVAQFKREDLEALAVGNHVVVYVASVRASARVVSARAPDSPVLPFRETEGGGEQDSDPFSFDDVAETLEESHAAPVVAGAVTAAELLVTFTFGAAKEFVVVGHRVLVMPGGGPGLYGGHERGEKGMAGLEGFVGTITETFGRVL